MDRRQKLLQRLDEIARTLAETGQGRALIGCGSVGLELDRLDEYSDLDFFAVVEPGHKAAFVSNPGWMAAAHPIAFVFQNTVDGHKLLFADGIFAEMAVFEEHELAHIPFAPGRVVWKAPDFDETLATPQMTSLEGNSAHSFEWLLGEALTNLYIGLGRFHRGEKLSGARFVQGYALDRLVDLAPFIENEHPGYRDVFAAERRFEQRHPLIATELAAFMQGYGRTPESARAMLAFLDRHFDVNAAMRDAILSLC